MGDGARKTTDAVAEAFDVVIVGGGPAGLSAALNLARARASVLVIDAGRPRNAATLRSHGFLTRDGTSPIELRKLARAELTVYPSVRVLDRSQVTVLSRMDAADGMRFRATVQSHRVGPPAVVSARSALISTGLRETLPEIPSLRAFYGMTVFSCAACDAWELQDRPLALIGETPDLPTRARLIARWTDDLTVFTNGADVVDAVEEAELAASGIVVERRRDRRPRGRPRHGFGRATRGRHPHRRSPAASCARAGIQPSTSSPVSTSTATATDTSSSTDPAGPASRVCTEQGTRQPPVPSRSSWPPARAPGPPPS